MRQPFCDLRASASSAVKGGLAAARLSETTRQARFQKTPVRATQRAGRSFVPAST